MNVMEVHASYAKVLDGRLAEAIAEGVQEAARIARTTTKVRYVLPVAMTLGCHLPPPPLTLAD